MNSKAQDSLTISGIDALDIRQMFNLFPKETLQFSDQGLNKGQHGDLGMSVAAFALTGMAIKALAAWLVQNRRKSRVKIQRSVVLPDGKIETHEVTMEDVSTGGNAEVIRDLLNGLKIDPGILNLSVEKS